VTDRTATLAVALAVDGIVGEVGGDWHPVAVTGRLLGRVYRPWRGLGPATELIAGGAALAAATGLAALLGWGAERLGGRRSRAGRGTPRTYRWWGLSGRGTPRPYLLGVLLKQTFSVRRLLEEGAGVADSLERGQLDQARLRLRALVSRPTGELTAEQCASAAIESLAENLADSVAAPLFFYSLLGLPAAAAYRVVNTADAMVGYRGETEWLGKTAARLDDVLSWAPSRLSALALSGAALALRGPAAAGSAWRTWRRDGARTASPNAGRPMSAMAGALDLRLEKPGHYVLGGGSRQPVAADVRAAVRLTGAATALLAAAALLWGARR
jgi:adenosylcobinamide-phosphate synthase